MCTLYYTTSWINNPSGGSIGGSIYRLYYYYSYFVFSYEHCTLIALYKYGDTYAPKPRGNSLPTKDNRTWVADQEPVNMKRLEP